MILKACFQTFTMTHFIFSLALAIPETAHLFPTAGFFFFFSQIIFSSFSHTALCIEVNSDCGVRRWGPDPRPKHVELCYPGGKLVNLSVHSWHVCSSSSVWRDCFQSRWRCALHPPRLAHSRHWAHANVSPVKPISFSISSNFIHCLKTFCISEAHIS